MTSQKQVAAWKLNAKGWTLEDFYHEDYLQQETKLPKPISNPFFFINGRKVK